MSLHKGTLSWPMVAAIGISIVVAGQLSGWNFGLEYGWGNMFIAFIIMFLFYAGLCQCISELSSTWPSAGGLSTFVRLAFGNWAGAFIGIATGLALISCVGVVATFIVGYAASIIGFDPIFLKIFLFLAIILLNIRGAKDLVSITLIVGFIAVATLLTFSFGVMPKFTVHNLHLENQPIALIGIVSALPFALWMFVGIEHTVTTAEETKNPKQDIPKGLTFALLTLATTACLILFTAAGAVGSENLSTAIDPLLAAITQENLGWLKTIIMVGALFALLASFFSITYSASRQVFDISREKFLPDSVSKVNKLGSPIIAILIVALMGFGISFIDPERVMLGVVTMFTLTYIMTSAAFLKLRKTKANTPRAYTAKGGIILGYLVLSSSLFLFLSSFKFDLVVLAPVVILLVIAILKTVTKKRAAIEDLYDIEVKK